jgi:hypothetical protein
MSPLAHVAPLPYNHRQSTDAAAQQDNKPQFELPRAERPTAITFATDLVQPKPKPFDLGFDSSGAMKRLGESSKSTMVGAFSDSEPGFLGDECCNLGFFGRLTMWLP